MGPKLEDGGALGARGGHPHGGVEYTDGMPRWLFAIKGGLLLAMLVGAAGFVELVGIAQEVAARLVPGSAPRRVLTCPPPMAWRP